MAGIDDFNKDMKRATLNINLKSEKVVRSVALQLFGAIIKDTPVDTGRLRSNWQTNIGAPSNGTITAFDKNGTLAVGLLKTEVGFYKIGEKIFLTNNLPYASAIEDGHSKQRPNGMVKTNVARFQAVVDQIARAQK